MPETLRPTPKSWAQSACQTLTEMDSEITSGQHDLATAVQQASTLNDAGGALLASFTTSDQIFANTILELQAIGTPTSPGGSALTDSLVTSLRNTRQVNHRAANKFEGMPWSSGQELQSSLIEVQRYMGRQETDLDLHQPIAGQAAQTGDKRLTHAVKTTATCQARDRRERAIRQQLDLMYQ